MTANKITGGFLQRIAQEVADAIVRLYPKSYFESLNGRLDGIDRKLELMEYFSHGGHATYVGNNRVLTRCVVRNAIIAFFLEADDRLLSPWFIVAGRYEEVLTNYFVDNLKPDSHSIDVGANFGYFTCLFSRFCPQGKVIGIEAEENVHAIARDNVYINGFERIARVIHAAASDTSAPMTLHARGTRSANTSIARRSDAYIRSMAEPESRAFTVPGVRVDDLLKDMGGRVDFLKVDVEGAEPLVFEGARETIAANPQLRAVMEWSPKQIKSARFDLPKFLSDLEGMGLSFYDIEPAGLAPLTADQLLALPYRAGVVLTRRENLG